MLNDAHDQIFIAFKHLGFYIGATPAAQPGIAETSEGPRAEVVAAGEG